ncbi:MAG: DUF3194 domain-containing protein [Candidatus Heimdallarchaeota archaeon]|nr:MAG: DUF3194 domain-containing protein [Candidatus Heimdallarchaeota archaeon]
MAKDLDEIIDQLYIRIHQFLVAEVGEDLEEDLIDLSLETTPNGELVINIDLYLEFSPFSKHNIQEIAEEAVQQGIRTADQICPPFVTKIRDQLKK